MKLKFNDFYLFFKLKKYFILSFLSLRINSVYLFLSLVIAILLVINFHPSWGQSLPPSSEIRGVWLTNVDSDILYSPKALTSGLKRLKSINFNTLYPTVWQGGYTLYPSAVTQREFGVSIDPHPGLKNRDMLQEIVTQGHQQGFTVIPWFEFGLMTSANSELVKKHPDWITQRKDGSTIKKEGVEERVWLNPFHPDVQNFILQLITEIVKNYKIDGIQFDDHFGLPAEFGYDNYTLKLYQQEHNGQSPSSDFYETYWVRWRADKINQLMKRTFETIKSIKPDCIVSLSPNPLHFALPAYLQDWFTWERKGWIEELVLQIYRSDLNRFITELDRSEVILAKDHIPVAIGILSGLKNRSTSMEIIKQQITEIRRRNFAGVSFFFYESLWNWSEESQQDRQTQLYQFFPNAVNRPKVRLTF
ncbi:glycoside hydrolase family 10 protein [Planktothrix mougeotii]|uniref:Glycoside hydrolase family 10 protein n=1 Tax=Planktothrix mougeotii LEGE 06226 TaxID=1828728 RepID=A0ABR9UKJ5_9CYAN|nr:glycoside hydrolase family 10 protein [Planktothrix mougeotii]MBE9146689.1 glycoside hydrolase family 10 protein [Planktothrix mougeotii LEGE 06226]